MKTKKNAITYLLLAFFAIFPVACNDYYFDITYTRYVTYCIFCILLIFAGICLYLKQEGKKRPVWRKMDVGMAVFLLANFCSVLFSEWKWAAFTGNQGKYIGFLFIFLAVLVYFSVSNYGWWEKKCCMVFPVMLTLLSLMAVIQFAGVDIFGFYKDMAEGTEVMYLSTMGHVDVYAAFLSIYLSFCMYQFCFEKLEKKKRLLYGISIFAGSLSMFCSNSDASYLAFFAAWLFLLFRSRKEEKGIRLFWVENLVVFAALLSFMVILKLPGAREYTGLTGTILRLSPGYVLYLLFLASFLFLIKKEKAKKILFISFAAVVCGVAVFFLGAFFYFSVCNREYPLGEWENYLRFSKEWGSQRGYVWGWLWDYFCHTSVIGKIFGAGADTTTLLLNENYYQEMQVELGVYYASAHNEYLNYLVTIGLAGVLSYLFIVGDTIVNCIKKSREEAFYGGIAMALVSYVVMAVVNISQPITMPFLFYFLALGNLKKNGN